MDAPAPRIEARAVSHRYRGRKHYSIERNAPQQPTAAIIHWTAGWGDVDGLWSYLKRAGADESYNYAIDRMARIGEYVPSADAAWHAGDGKLPPADVLLRDGFVATKDVPYTKRLTNLRSIGIAFCNRGYLNESGLIEARSRGALVSPPLDHPNPRSKSTRWEGYRDQQIASFTWLLGEMKRRHPTLVMVMGHEDVTNYDALNSQGSKLDPGPAFPWDRVPLADLGIALVRYDYARHGWRVIEPAGDVA